MSAAAAAAAAGEASVDNVLLLLNSCAAPAASPRRVRLRGKASPPPAEDGDEVEARRPASRDAGGTPDEEGRLLAVGGTAARCWRALPLRRARALSASPVRCAHACSIATHATE
jgi:hypothetical protein